MNPEKLQLNRSEHTNATVEKQDLSSEQKKTLGEIWATIVTDIDDVPENIETMTQTEIKQYLYESLMQGIENFSKELGLTIDNDLVKKIQNTSNPEEKSAFELEYIKQAHAQIDNIVKGLNRLQQKVQNGTHGQKE